MEDITNTNNNNNNKVNLRMKLLYKEANAHIIKQREEIKKRIDSS